VYRRAGGHAYGTVIPGPIGSVLGPALGGKQGAELPHASTLCGSCSAVCPVKIDLHGQLLAWRGERRSPARGERLLTRAAAIALRWPALRGGARALLRPLWPLLVRRHPRNPAEPWLTVRELPPLPKQSFRQQWQAKRAASRESSEPHSKPGSSGRAANGASRNSSEPHSKPGSSGRAASGASRNSSEPHSKPGSSGRAASGASVGRGRARSERSEP
jgi:ferredoxin